MMGNPKRSFVMNNCYELDVWHWIMNWKDLMPVQSLVQLLV